MIRLGQWRHKAAATSGRATCDPLRSVCRGQARLPLICRLHPIGEGRASPTPTKTSPGTCASAPSPVPPRRRTGVRVLRYDMGRAAFGFVNCDEQTASMMSDPVSRLPYPVSRILFCPPRWSPDTMPHRLSTGLSGSVNRFLPGRSWTCQETPHPARGIGLALSPGRGTLSLGASRPPLRRPADSLEVERLAYPRKTAGNHPVTRRATPFVRRLMLKDRSTGPALRWGSGSLWMCELRRANRL